MTRIGTASLDSGHSLGSTLPDGNLTTIFPVIDTDVILIDAGTIDIKTHDRRKENVKASQGEATSDATIPPFPPQAYAASSLARTSSKHTVDGGTADTSFVPVNTPSTTSQASDPAVDTALASVVRRTDGFDSILRMPTPTATRKEKSTDRDPEKALHSNDGEADMDANATEVTFNPQIASQSDAQDLPEGGFAAWATVIGAAMMQFSTFGYANAFGVFQDYYTRTYLDKYTTSEIGWIGGTQFFLIYSCGVVTGPLFDAGYFRHVTIVGSLLNVFCMFMLSLARNNQYYQIFLCQGIGIGLSSGLIYIPALTISSRYFSRRRALTMGIIAAGGALGAIVHPIVLNNLFAFVDFGTGVRVDAAVNAMFLLIANFLVRDRRHGVCKRGDENPKSDPLQARSLGQKLTSVCIVCRAEAAAAGKRVVRLIMNLVSRSRTQKSRHERSEESLTHNSSGQLSVHHQNGAPKKITSIHFGCPPLGSPRRRIAHYVSVVVAPAHFLREPPFALVCLGGCMCFFGLFYPVFYLQLNAVAHGVDQHIAFYALSVFNAASLVGRIAPGAVLVPYFGSFNMVIVFNTALGVTTCTMAAVHSLAGTFAFALACGFANGCATGMTPPMVATLAKSRDEIGARMGVFFFLCGVVSLFAEPIAGALMGVKYDHWLGASMFSGIFLVCAAITMLVARIYVLMHQRS